MWRNINDGGGGSGARTRFHSIKAIECVEFFCYNKLKAISKTFGLSFIFLFFSCVSPARSLSSKSHRNNQSFVIMLLVKLAVPTPLAALLLPSLFSTKRKWFCVSLLSSLMALNVSFLTHSLTARIVVCSSWNQKNKLFSVYLLLCMNFNITRRITHTHTHCKWVRSLSNTKQTFERTYI